MVPGRPALAAWLALVAVVAACGGTTAPREGTAVDGGGEGSIPLDGTTDTALPAPDAPGGDATGEAGADADAGTDAGVDGSVVLDAAVEAGPIIPVSACSMSLQCGQGGDSCCGTSGMTCYCQSYGQPRCLAQPAVQDGHAGDACTPSNTCEPGLTCVRFGGAGLCFHCGN